MRDLLLGSRFEVIPTPSIEERILALPRERKLTITCSPSRGIDTTLTTARSLRGAGYQVVPHLAARQVHGPDHLEVIAQTLSAAQVTDVFVIGGDAEPEGPYETACHLLEAFDRIGYRPENIGIGGYPEGHPQADPETLLEALLQKQRFATYMVSQLCFDAEAIRRWAEHVREEGVTLPLLVGIPGAVDRRKLLEVSLRVGVGDSVRFLSRNVGAVARLLSRSRLSPDDLIGEVAGWAGAYGVEGFHVYTFNQIDGSEAWLQRAIAG